MAKNFISLFDWSSEEIKETLALAQELKKWTKEGYCPQILAGKQYAMFFHKNSLRTRISFEVGIRQLGGATMFLTESDFAIGKRESVADVARVMSRYVDGILIRTFDHNLVLQMAKYAEVPVINMLTDLCHPCQIFADALTIQEEFGQLENTRIAYLGDGNNIAHSFMHLAARIPIHLTIGTSAKTLPNSEILTKTQDTGVSSIRVTSSAEKAIKEAQVVYTDVWTSMGQKEQAEKQKKLLQAFQVNKELMQLADPHARVMHCLPAERGKEITADVIDGPQSIVFAQAENRLHAQKAILMQLDRWHS